MWVANIILHERVLNNYTGNQNIPSRAVGENLDALGELFYAHDRPQAQPAVCTERFYISEPQTMAILIPAGTRVTDYSEKLVWETVEDAYVSIGDTYADVPIRCQSAGKVGNDYAPGQINTFVDLYDYCERCENITVSDSGADTADDEEFYELLRTSMDAYSTAGSEGSYVYHAKSVSTEIGDVKAIRPQYMEFKQLPLYERNGSRWGFIGGDTIEQGSLVIRRADGSVADSGRDYDAVYAGGLLTIQIMADGALADQAEIHAEVSKLGAGEVEIFVLMDDGEIAGDEIKSAVLEACSDRTVRPLTDNVEVRDPDIVGYDIDITYYIKRQSAGNSAAIQSAVTDAVERYKTWQAARLGRDINPSKLTEMIMETGVKRVVIRKPEYTVLSDGSQGRVPDLAAVGSVTVINGGIEEE
jgi:phage-related baseplate assembly protein